MLQVKAIDRRNEEKKYCVEGLEIRNRSTVCQTRGEVKRLTKRKKRIALQGENEQIENLKRSNDTRTFYRKVGIIKREYVPGPKTTNH